MNATQAGRLLTLAHFLKTEVKPKNFDMHTWGNRQISYVDVVRDPNGKVLSEVPPGRCDIGGSLLLGQSEEVQMTYTVERKALCNTSACALGWATEVFPESLRLKWDDWNMADVQIKLPSGQWTKAFNSPVMRDFFGISMEESEDLFGGDNMTLVRKAKQIEKLVDKHGYTYA